MSGGHDHHHEDSIAPGGAPGRIATNWETLTGKERDEYVANLEGKKAIDIDDEFEPTYLGTKKRPQMIKSVVDVQHVGCSGILFDSFIEQNMGLIGLCKGYPTGGHPHVWVSVYEEGHLYWDLGFNRCPECGMVFK